MTLLKRTLSGLLTILLISMLLFFVFQVIPGNPVLSRLGSEEIDNNPVLAERLRREFKLDEPPIERYFTWLFNVFKGNLGNSFQYSRPVTELISTRLTPTLVLTFLSMIVTVALSIPLGLFVSKKAKTSSETLYNLITQLGIAIPSFWLAIVLMWIFALRFKWFSTRSTIDFNNLELTLKSLVLPVITLSVGNISAVIRHLLNAVNNERGKQYVVFAKAKGLSDDEVLKVHVLKNSMIPIVTILGLILIDLTMGSIFVENIYNIQGLGSILIAGIKANDYPLVQGIILFYSVLVVVINYIMDLIYMKIDPRISLE